MSNKKVLFLLPLLFPILAYSLSAIGSAQVEKKAYEVYVGHRTGAICQDGTRSYATGRGACSWHGGVAHWLYTETRYQEIRRTKLAKNEKAIRLSAHISLLPIAAYYFVLSYWPSRKKASK
jgi:hypothetical protein